MVLNVVSSSKTMKNMIDLVSEISHLGNSYLVFQPCDSFGSYFRPPKVMLELFRLGWDRSGHPPFVLTKIL